METGTNSAVGLVFIDDTTFSLGPQANAVLDEWTYDPASKEGSGVLTMIKGAFAFLTGDVAKSGPDAMVIKTPTATIGIRGTNGAGRADDEGNANSFTLLFDPEGSIGEMLVSTSTGIEVLNTPFQTTQVFSAFLPPSPVVTMPASLVQQFYGAATSALPPPPAVTGQQAANDGGASGDAAISTPGPNATNSAPDSAPDSAQPDQPPGAIAAVPGADTPLGPQIAGNEGAPGPFGADGPADGDAPPPGSPEAVAQEAFDRAVADGASLEEAFAAAVTAAGGALPQQATVPFGPSQTNSGRPDGEQGSPEGVAADPFGPGADPGRAADGGDGAGLPNIGPVGVFGPGPGLPTGLPTGLPEGSFFDPAFLDQSPFDPTLFDPALFGAGLIDPALFDPALIGLIDQGLTFDEAFDDVSAAAEAEGIPTRIIDLSLLGGSPFNLTLANNIIDKIVGTGTGETVNILSQAERFTVAGEPFADIFEDPSVGDGDVLVLQDATVKNTIAVINVENVQLAASTLEQTVAVVNEETTTITPNTGTGRTVIVGVEFGFGSNQDIAIAGGNLLGCTDVVDLGFGTDVLGLNAGANAFDAFSIETINLSGAADVLTLNNSQPNNVNINGGGGADIVNLGGQGLNEVTTNSVETVNGGAAFDRVNSR